MPLIRGFNPVLIPSAVAMFLAASGSAAAGPVTPPGGEQHRVQVIERLHEDTQRLKAELERARLLNKLCDLNAAHPDCKALVAARRAKASVKANTKANGKAATQVTAAGPNEIKAGAPNQSKSPNPTGAHIDGKTLEQLLAMVLARTQAGKTKPPKTKRHRALSPRIRSNSQAKVYLRRHYLWQVSGRGRALSALIQVPDRNTPVRATMGQYLPGRARVKLIAVKANAVLLGLRAHRYDLKLED